MITIKNPKGWEGITAIQANIVSLIRAKLQEKDILPDAYVAQRMPIPSVASIPILILVRNPRKRYGCKLIVTVNFDEIEIDIQPYQHFDDSIADAIAAVAKNAITSILSNHHSSSA